MITVVFHFTDWDNYPGTDNPQSLMHKWRHNSCALHVDKLVMIDSSTYKIGKYYNHTSSDISFERFETLDDFLNQYTGTVVCLEIKDGASTLCDFVHPEGDVAYISGPNHSSISSDIVVDHWVKIPSNLNYPLYDDSAIMVTLYDRLVKINK